MYLLNNKVLLNYQDIKAIQVRGEIWRRAFLILKLVNLVICNIALHMKFKHNTIYTRDTYVKLG